MSGIPILVVEDDLLSSLETCDTLRASGFDVQEVSGARGAFNILDRNGPLMALVTDINLGPGADGYEIARCARETYPDLAVIYCSASAASRQILEGVKDSRFIAKPYDCQEVVRTLRGMLSPGRPVDKYRAVA